MTSDTTTWGPYRSSVNDRLAHCEDYLSRLRRSLVGEIAPDRHYFSDKAHELRTAAQGLVDLVNDVERWLGACGAEFTPSDAWSGGLCNYLATCGLPKGHDGQHVEEQHTDDERLIQKSREAAHVLRDALDRIPWVVLAGARGDDATDAAENVMALLVVARRKLDEMAFTLDRFVRSAPKAGSRSS